MLSNDLKKRGKEILEEIIARRTKPFTMGGSKHEFTGEIFYSDIFEYCKTYFHKKSRNEAYQYFCDELRKSNFYIHS